MIIMYSIYIINCKLHFHIDVMRNSIENGYLVPMASCDKCPEKNAVLILIWHALLSYNSHMHSFNIDFNIHNFNCGAFSCISLIFSHSGF